MFPNAKDQSPTTATYFMPHLTLASINARQSESPNTNYTKQWGPDYTLDSEISSLGHQHDFQSNSIFEDHLHLGTSPSPGRAGLGIQYPEHSPDLKRSLSQNNIHADSNEVYLSFSPRLNTSYSSGGTTFEDPDSSLGYSLQSSWSLSLLYPEVLHGGEQDSAGSSVPSTDASIRESGSEDFTLESLSAAAGLSVEEFTNKITEGAKYALKTVADYEQSGSAPADSSGRGIFPQLAPFPEIANLVDPWLPSGIGINPADVMPAPSLLPGGASLDRIFNILGTQLQSEDQDLDYPRLPALLYPVSPPMLGMPSVQPRNRVPIGSPQPREDADQLSEYEPPAFLSPSSSEYSPSLGYGRQYQTRSNRVKKRKIQQCDTILAPVQAPPTDSLPLPPIDLGSPVFDAHRGINLEDLKARAERYRLRNQGREYDKRWLLSFAGKLSNKGELLEEFRCYITGCKQVNKRRDHILIHVGAHLDQRPFRCVHCDARFLRKNECKRHELSHTGIRPFTCNLCQDPAPTFVRQDLLRRHMKRTHQVDDEKENKPSASRPRKKVRKF